MKGTNLNQNGRGRRTNDIRFADDNFKLHHWRIHLASFISTKRYDHTGLSLVDWLHNRNRKPTGLHWFRQLIIVESRPGPPPLSPNAIVVANVAITTTEELKYVVRI